MTLAIIVTGLIGIIKNNDDYFLIIPEMTGYHQHELRVSNYLTTNTFVEVEISNYFNGHFLGEKVAPGVIPYIPSHSRLKTRPKYNWSGQNLILKMKDFMPKDDNFSIDGLLNNGMHPRVFAKIKIPKPTLKSYVFHGKKTCSNSSFKRNMFLYKGKRYFAESVVFFFKIYDVNDEYFLYSEDNASPRLLRKSEMENLMVLSISHLPRCNISSMSDKERHENALFRLYENAKGDPPEENKLYYPRSHKCNHQTLPEIENDLLDYLKKIIEKHSTNYHATGEYVGGQVIFENGRSPDNKLSCPPYLLEEEE